MKRILSVLLLFPFFVKSQTGAFTFTLSNAARTSAGVFKTDSTLVRTLWADRNYAAGTFTEYWDGKDDFGNRLTSPDANYMIKVLSNNVTYTWDGIIGNTSIEDTGKTVHRGYYTSMTGMAITGTTAYFCQGYSEGYSSEAKFSTLNPQVRLDIYPGKVSTMNSDYVATDGINVYWAGYDAYRTMNSFVHVTKVVDDSEVSFGTNGSKYTMQQIGYPKTYNSTIDKSTLNNSKPSGLAVQTTGNYLFVSHRGLNQLHVLNKSTGALVQNFTITSPGGLSTDGANLWIVSGTTVSKYAVNSNGTIGSKLMTLSGISVPGAIQVKGSMIAVIDGGSNQIVRFFNTTTGAQGTQLGVTGGYSVSADVTNTKFFFDDYRGNLNSFIAWHPDGTFWVGDPGNFRELHFDAGRNYKETIMSLGASYATDVDKNNINRVFAEYLEFAIDYTKPLSGSTGWRLTKNWGYYTTTGYDHTKKMQNHITLSNGRTYAMIYSVTVMGEIVELTSSGGVKFSGVHPMSNSIMCKDGSLQHTTGTSAPGGSVIITKYPSAGFDAAGVPLWSKIGTVLVTTPPNTLKNPNLTPVTEVLTASNKVIFYVPYLWYQGIASQKYDGYHLGAIKVGTNTWQWKTQQATPSTYKGSFPEADYFETGNGVSQSAGSRVTVVDNNIITGYNGEFWKNVQTNYYNHYLDDGLAIAQFGTDRYFTGGVSAAGSAGNELTPAVVKDANGDLYLYHGDESQHGGVHRWKISNLSSVKEQYMNIPFPQSYSKPALGYIDLHAGLPSNTTLPNSNGWTKTGVVTSITGTKKYINDGSPDIYSSFNQLTGTASIQRDLGSNNVSASWKVSGMLTYEFSDITAGSGITAYLDVLDAAGKIISRFYYTLAHSTKVLTLYANSAIVATGANLGPTLFKYQPFEVNVVNGLVTFAYANYAPVTTTLYDPTANWKQPKTLRQYFVGAFPAYGETMGFMDMRFYIDYTLAGRPHYITSTWNNKLYPKRELLVDEETYD